MGAVTRQVERADPLGFVKRVGVVWVVMVVVAGALWGVSWMKVRGRVGEMEGRLRARGEPVTLAELGGTRAKEGENAAVALGELGRRVSETFGPPRSSNEFYSQDELPYPTIWWLMANASAGYNKEVIEKAEEACRNIERFDTGVTLDRGAMGYLNSVMPMLNGLRSMASTLADESLRRHFVGEDDGAFDLMHANLTVADCLYDEPVMVCFFVGLGIESVALDDIPMMATRLRVGSGVGEVSSERVRELIGRLERKSRPDQGLVMGVRGDMLFSAELVSGRERRAFFTAPFGQALRAEILAEIDRQSEGRPAAGSRPMGKATLSAQTAAAMLSNLRGANLNISRIECRRAMSMTALAVALYRHEHGGQYPESIEALVPGYLERVPTEQTGGSPVPLSIRIFQWADGTPRPILEAPGMRPTLPTASELRPTPQYDYEHTNVKYRFVDLAYRETPPPTDPPPPSRQ